MSAVRFSAVTAPYRRGGLVFKAAGVWQALAASDITVGNVIALLADDRGIRVEVAANGADDAWEPLDGEARVSALAKLREHNTAPGGITGEAGAAPAAPVERGGATSTTAQDASSEGQNGSGADGDTESQGGLAGPDQAIGGDKSPAGEAGAAGVVAPAEPTFLPPVKEPAKPPPAKRRAGKSK